MGVLLNTRYIGGFALFLWETHVLLVRIRERGSKRYVFYPPSILITLASGVIMDTIEFPMHLLDKWFSFKLSFTFTG